MKVERTVDVCIPVFTCQHASSGAQCIPCRLKKTSPREAITFYRLLDENNVYWYKVAPESKDAWDSLVKRFKDYIIQVVKGARKKLYWKAFYTLLEVCDADLNYVYASTIHKYQGSSCSSVYVNMSDIRRARNDTPRLIYTAVSRAIDSVCFIE